jgi:hypothetical protein
MKTYAGLEGELHTVLTSALDGVLCSVSRSGHFITSRRTAVTHLTGDWIGPRDDGEEKVPVTVPTGDLTLEPRPSGP